MAIYKRGGTYWMNFWSGGQHVQRSTKCRNKRDAETFERAWRTQLAMGEVGIEPKKRVPKFKEAMQAFLDWAKVEHAAKPNTYIRHKTASAALLRFLGDVSLDRISPADIEKFKVFRSQQRTQPRGVKPKDEKLRSKIVREKRTVAKATVNRELATLKRMLSLHVKDDVIASNPVSKVKFFNEDNQQNRVLTFDEERLYLLACSQPLQDFATVMLDTGLRPDELSRLTRLDVFIDQGHLEVRHGKTKAARRRVPLTRRASEILKSRMGNAKCDYIFASPRGEGKDARPVGKLNNAHYAAVKRANLEHFRIYDLRHTFGTRQGEAGTDIVTLAALLGHARLEMVLRYVHPSAAHKIEAIRRMDEAHAGRANSKAKAAK
jgi:integrase